MEREIAPEIIFFQISVGVIPMYWSYYASLQLLIILKSGTSQNLEVS